jgi:hypothetical protein
MIALLLTAVLMHPVHETLAEVEWNDQTGRLEVALRLHSLDEQWLRKQNSRKRTDRVWTTEYVQRNFRVTPLPKKRELDLAKYTWIGRQQDGAHVWWYFEIECPDKAKPKWIEQRTLFERQDNYTNRVLIMNEKPKRSMSLTRKRPRGSLVK